MGLRELAGEIEGCREVVVRDIVERRGWLRERRRRVTQQGRQVDQRVQALSHGPCRLVRCFHGYFVNGFKFHTQYYAHGKKIMNCGICVKGNCYNDYEKDFYGMLVDILELEYFGANNKVVLFKCDWYDTEKGVRVHPRHGLVEINYKSRLHPNDPFVLAQQAQQVYYTRYPSKKKGRSDWWAVCKTKARSRYDISVIEDNDDSIPPTIDEFYQEDESSVVQPVNTTYDLDNSSILVAEGRADEVDQTELFFLRSRIEELHNAEVEDEEELEDFEDDDTEEDDEEDAFSNSDGND